MRRVAVANQKGGVGKTTTVVNLAAALAERGRRVLVLDLDPQGSATSWCGLDADGRGAMELLTGELPPQELVRPTGWDGVALLPASAWLLGAEKALSRADAPETRLARRLEELPAGDWDVLLVDCPPNLGLLTVNALAAADEVLLPVEARVLALRGLVQILQTLETVRERLNPALGLGGILACRVDRRTRHCLEVVERLRQRFGERVYGVVVRENVRLAECPSFAQPILAYAPRSAGAADFRSLAAEFLARQGRPA